jgi:hypothetical protein
MRFSHAYFKTAFYLCKERRAFRYPDRIASDGVIFGASASQAYLQGYSFASFVLADDGVDEALGRR